MAALGGNEQVMVACYSKEDLCGEEEEVGKWGNMPIKILILSVL